MAKAVDITFSIRVRVPDKPYIITKLERLLDTLEMMTNDVLGEFEGKGLGECEVTDVDILKEGDI